MIKTITQDDLIKYVYGETNSEENEQIEISLSLDEELKNDLSDFTFIKNEIKKIDLSPSQRMVDNLIFFSKNYSA
ncbi:hypothetical protein HZR84_05805 [Hyphobacterium sp. CCMP332]|nr:hypothetical protein HZR84_05805 [Hyphobacterium sp. CCMP332]